MRQRTYSKTVRRGDRGFALALASVILWFAIIIAVNVAVVIVALHFILKYW